MNDLNSENYQLLWTPGTTKFMWNPSFDRFQNYWGMEIELPLRVKPETGLYFAYCTNESWQEPFLLEFENVAFDSFEIAYNDGLYLAPRYEEWYGEIVANEEYDYELVNYYLESFTVYSAGTYDYTYEFELDYSLSEEFVNLSVYKVVGLNITFGETTIKNRVFVVNYIRNAVGVVIGV